MKLPWTRQTSRRTPSDEWRMFESWDVVGGLVFVHGLTSAGDHANALSEAYQEGAGIDLPSDQELAAEAHR